jgi:hypothetical protein
MTKTVLEVLEGALEILRDQKRWTKGNDAIDRYGNRCSISGGICFCAFGAIVRASGHDFFYGYAAIALANAINVRTITDWNDAPERTHAEIIQGFEKAIAVEKSK